MLRKMFGRRGQEQNDGLGARARRGEVRRHTVHRTVMGDEDESYSD